MDIINIFSKKKIIWAVIVLVIIGGAWYYKTMPKNNTANITTAVVGLQNLKQTLLVTGKIVSETSLSLSFQGGGMVSEIKVKTGDQVETGDTLAILNQSNARASLTSANGQLAQANATYQKVLNGASPEQINIYQKAVDSAQVAYDNALSQQKITQDSVATEISQAQANLDHLKSSALTSDSKRSAIIVNISKVLVAIRSDLDQQAKIIDDDDFELLFSVKNGSYLISFKGKYNQVQGLLDQANASLAVAQANNSDANLDQAVIDALTVLNQNIISLNYCYSALQNSITSASFSEAQLDVYKTAVSTALSNENSGITLIKSSHQVLTDTLRADSDTLKADADALRNATDVLTNSKLSADAKINSIQNQINTTKAALQQAEAVLVQQKAKAQAADIDVAKAQILSARGLVEAAQNALNDTVLKAPANGTITKIDAKVGEQAVAMQAVLFLQNIDALLAEVYVSEANIASLKIDQIVDCTFDSLGLEKHFDGKILTINPASTEISGVVNYLVKVSLPNISEIKPGMTINMAILTASRENVLAIPVGAIINQNGEQYVRTIDDVSTKKYHETKVQTGILADGGIVEILNGLSKGQELVKFVE